MTFRKLFSVLSVLTVTFATLMPHIARAGAPVDPDTDYDRLDGTGKSGKKVDVIEWEGNLEIHVYPKGSTAGLGMKIDEKNGKKVMVIAYRFIESPKTVLTRRAILGIPLSTSFKVYKDPIENEFDKFIISDNGLSGQVVAYKLDATPTQLYPDGHPALAKGADDSARKPASVDAAPAQNPGGVDDNGSVQPFFMQRDNSPGGHGGRN